MQLAYSARRLQHAGDWETAAVHYTTAIKAARLDQPDSGRAHTAALLSNRSAALLRSGQPLLVRLLMGPGVFKSWMLTLRC